MYDSFAEPMHQLTLWLETQSCKQLPNKTTSIFCPDATATSFIFIQLRCNYGKIGISEF